MFEGDICISDKQWEHLNHRISPVSSSSLDYESDSQSPQRIQRAVVNKDFLKWINGVVPYVLADDLSELNPIIS